MDFLAVKSAYIEKIKKGYPWVYTYALSSLPDFPIGTLVYLTCPKKKPFAIAYFNPNSKIACRVLTLDWKTTIDSSFFFGRFNQALSKREQRFTVPYYRLIHAEGDALPGLIIDRYNDILVCQTNTAGMEKLKPLWTKALTELLKPSSIIYKDNSKAREKEGLTNHLFSDAPSSAVKVIEHNTTFFATLTTGQKTGWFYDQRENRRWMSSYCKKKTVLDLYTYSGGFGISAAKAGASAVTLVDSSPFALNLATQAAEENLVAQNCRYINEDVFELLPKLHEENEQFDVVIADPPAFIKQAEHKGAGLRGYQKLARMCAMTVKPGGLLFIASCSHHAPLTDFRAAVEAGITKSNRRFTFIRKGGADKDHPIHPMLPENYYLKALLYQLE